MFQNGTYHITVKSYFNPSMLNGISHPYELDESISNLRLLGSKFQFLSNFKSTFRKQTAEPDQTLRFAASDLALHCLTLSHKKDVWLKSVKHASKAI